MQPLILAHSESGRYCRLYAHQQDLTTQHQWRNLPPMGHAQNGVCGSKDQAWTRRAVLETDAYRVDQFVLCEAFFDERYTTYRLSSKTPQDGDAINDHTSAAGA